MHFQPIYVIYLYLWRAQSFHWLLTIGMVIFLSQPNFNPVHNQHFCKFKISPSSGKLMRIASNFILPPNLRGGGMTFLYRGNSLVCFWGVYFHAFVYNSNNYFICRANKIQSNNAYEASEQVSQNFSHSLLCWSICLPNYGCYL